MDIAGKVFIVTGAASCLGEGTVRMLAANGAKVVIADLQVDKGEALALALGGAAAAHFVKCDVSQEADGQAVVAKAVTMGKLMGLANMCSACAPSLPTVLDAGAMPAQFTRPMSLPIDTALATTAWPSASWLTSHLTNWAAAAPPSSSASASP